MKSFTVTAKKRKFDRCLILFNGRIVLLFPENLKISWEITTRNGFCPTPPSFRLAVPRTHESSLTTVTVSLLLTVKSIPGGEGAIAPTMRYKNTTCEM